MVLVMTKYQEALTLLNQIESKYGSIVNCPEDDPDYLAIRKIYPSTGHGAGVVTAEDQIYRLAHEGYSISEIVNLVSGNDGAIYNFIKHWNTTTSIKIQSLKPYKRNKKNSNSHHYNH